MVVTFNIITWRVWQEQKSTAEDKSPAKLNGNGNPISTGIGTVLGGVTNDRCQENANGDTKLITCDKSSSNPLWTNFRPSGRG
jgi:hypothetical protein